MKKTFIVVFVTLFSFSAFAQKDPFFRFGLKGGVNLSNIRGNDLSLGSGGSAFNFKDNSNRSTGFVGGVFMRFGRNFYIQPEFLFSQKGGTFNAYKDGLTNEEGKVDVRFSNFDVPVLIGGRIGKVFRINVGPVASLRLTNNGKIGDSFRNYTGENAQDEYNNNVTFGYQAGVGLDLGRLSLDVRYEGNLNDVVSIQYGNQNTATQFGRQSNLWQATVGFSIF
jgi:hypothetical protein